MDDLTKAIAEAVAEKGGAVIADDTPADAPVATPGDAQLSKGEDTTPAVTPAEPADGGEAVEDAPLEYWGTSLEGLEAEERAAVVAHFEQQDSTIQKLQTQLAELRKTAEAAPPAAPAEVEEVSDEDLLTAMGFDPEDWQTDQIAPKVLPLARTLLSLEDKVAAMEQKTIVQEAETTWNRSLDDLEQTYGKLPFDRLEVLQYAIQEQIPSPEAAYFRLSAPIKREVDTVVAKARQEAAKKAAAAGVKPASSSAGPNPVDPKASFREQVEQAAMAAEKETGTKWSSIFGR